MQTREEKLKEIILQKYSSVRSFAREVGIPHGTLVSALNNGIDGMAWGRLNAICEKLQIDPVSLEPIAGKKESVSAEEKRMLAYYDLLNAEGKMKVEEYMKDISRIPSYYEKK